MRRTQKGLAITLAACGLQLACGDATGPASVLTVRFKVASQAAASDGGGGTAFNRNASIGITGTNGVLVLDDLRLVVAEFELERTNLPDDNVGQGSNGGEKEEFEAPPAFVQVPLVDGEVPVVQQAVPPGQYREFEFNVEDLDADDDDQNAGDITALLEEIRAAFPDWPEKASMLVVGSFTPDGGASVPFRVFFQAEIGIEMEFDPPLVVEADVAGPVVDITIDPSLWFLRGDGTVMDLSQFDFDATGELLEFEFEMEDGFAEIEFDR